MRSTLPYKGKDLPVVVNFRVLKKLAGVNKDILKNENAAAETFETLQHVLLYSLKEGARQNGLVENYTFEDAEDVLSEGSNFPDFSVMFVTLSQLSQKVSADLMPIVPTITDTNTAEKKA